MIDLENVCRVCSTSNSLLLDLFGSQSQKYAEDANKCLSLEVTQGDGLPSQICINCVGLLSDCRPFVDNILKLNSGKDHDCRSESEKEKECYFCCSSDNCLFNIPYSSISKTKDCFSLDVKTSCKICHKCQFHLEKVYELKQKACASLKQFYSNSLTDVEKTGPRRKENVSDIVDTLKRKFKTNEDTSMDVKVRIVDIKLVIGSDCLSKGTVNVQEFLDLLNSFGDQNANNVKKGRKKNSFVMLSHNTKASLPASSELTKSEKKEKEKKLGRVSKSKKDLSAVSRDDQKYPSNPESLETYMAPERDKSVLEESVTLPEISTSCGSMAEDDDKKKVDESTVFGKENYDVKKQKKRKRKDDSSSSRTIPTDDKPQRIIRRKRRLSEDECSASPKSKSRKKWWEDSQSYDDNSVDEPVADENGEVPVIEQPEFLKKLDELLKNTPKTEFKPFICSVCHEGYVSTVKGKLHKLIEHDPRSNMILKLNCCDDDPEMERMRIRLAAIVNESLCDDSVRTQNTNHENVADVHNENESDDDLFASKTVVKPDSSNAFEDLLKNTIPEPCGEEEKKKEVFEENPKDMIVDQISHNEKEGTDIEQSSDALKSKSVNKDVNKESSDVTSVEQSTDCNETNFGVKECSDGQAGNEESDVREEIVNKEGNKVHSDADRGGFIDTDQKEIQRVVESEVKGKGGGTYVRDEEECTVVRQEEEESHEEKKVRGSEADMKEGEEEEVQKDKRESEFCVGMEEEGCKVDKEEKEESRVQTEGEIGVKRKEGVKCEGERDKEECLVVRQEELKNQVEKKVRGSEVDIEEGGENEVEKTREEVMCEVDGEEGKHKEEEDGGECGLGKEGTCGIDNGEDSVGTNERQARETNGIQKETDRVEKSEELEITDSNLTQNKEHQSFGSSSSSINADVKQNCNQRLALESCSVSEAEKLHQEDRLVIKNSSAPRISLAESDEDQHADVESNGESGERSDEEKGLDSCSLGPLSDCPKSVLEKVNSESANLGANADGIIVDYD